MFTCIVVGDDYTRYKLVIALTSASYSEAVGIFSRVIRLWLSYIRNRDDPGMAIHGGVVEIGSLVRNPANNNTEHHVIMQTFALCESFYTRARSLLFRKIETVQCRTIPPNDRPLHNILDFVITAARHSMILQWGILDAGILALLPLALVNGISLLPALLDALDQQSCALPPKHRSSSGAGTDSYEPNTAVIPLDLINNEIFAIVHCVQAPQLQELLYSEVFATRRSICSLFLETFLGSEHGMGLYSETRNLLSQILTGIDNREPGCSFQGVSDTDRHGILCQH